MPADIGVRGIPVVDGDARGNMLPRHVMAGLGNGMAGEDEQQGCGSNQDGFHFTLHFPFEEWSPWPRTAFERRGLQNGKFASSAPGRRASTPSRLNSRAERWN